MKEVYKVENNNSIKIAEGSDGDHRTPYNFSSLNATQSNLIRITCLNNGGLSFGVGCFVLNNTCHCYNFEIDASINPNYTYNRSYNFGNILCSMIDIHCINQWGIAETKNYTYEHHIPLDANSISCQNSDNISFIQYGEKHVLSLRDYVTADFELKNLQVIITENY